MKLPIQGKRICIIVKVRYCNPYNVFYAEVENNSCAFTGVANHCLLCPAKLYIPNECTSII